MQVVYEYMLDAEECQRLQRSIFRVVFDEDFRMKGALLSGILPRYVTRKKNG